MPTADAAPILQVRGLEVRYGSVPALRDVDLEVQRGEIVGLIGPNGAGKSTTLHAIVGTVRASAGEILLGGVSIRGQAPERIVRSGVGLVPEGRRIFAALTVEENLRLGLAGRRSKNGAHEALEMVNELFPVLRESRRRHAGLLSGGQQQQLAIARALVSRPRLLLLDEPTEGIQPSTIKEIGRVLRRLLEQRMTLVLVEQYLDFALELAEHCVVLSRGEIVMRGKVKELDPAQVRRHLSV